MICDRRAASGAADRDQRRAAADHGREVGELARARNLAALARFLQASLRRLFGAFATYFGFGHQGTPAAGAPTSSETAVSALSMRLEMPDHDAVQPDDEHEEAGQQGDREPDAEQIELRRGAGDHAEREIDDHQRDHRGQRNQQARHRTPAPPTAPPTAENPGRHARAPMGRV